MRAFALAALLFSGCGGEEPFQPPSPRIACLGVRGITCDSSCVLSCTEIPFDITNGVWVNVVEPTCDDDCKVE